LLSAAVGDVDGDAKPDVVIHYYDSQTHEALLLNTGGGTFGSPLVASAADAEFPSSRFLIVDVNHDNKNDLVGVLSIDLIVRLGNGDGTFGPPLRSIAPTFTWNHVQLADFNGDG